MTLSKTKIKITHVANGTTDYIFVYDFRIDSVDDIEIYYDDVLQTPTPAFTNVTGLGSEAGGQVEFSAVPPACNLTIRRNVDLTQETDYLAYDSFPAETHEAALDYLMMVAQQQQELLDRQYIVGPSDVQPFIFSLGSIQHDSAGTALSIFVKNAGGTFQEMIKGTPDGPVELYYNDIKTLTTHGVGGEYGLLVRSLGGSTAAVVMQANEFILRNGAWGGTVQLKGYNASGAIRTLISCDPDNQVELYYNNNLRLWTTDVGIQVAGRGYFTRDGTDTVSLNKSVAGQYAAMSLGTAGAARWLFVCTNEAESGGNAGSNFNLQARDDSGGYLFSVIKVWRDLQQIWQQCNWNTKGYHVIFDETDGDSYIAADGTDDYIKVVCGNVTAMQLTNYGLILSAAKHLYMQNNTIIYCKNSADTTWNDMFRFNTADQLIINSAGFDTYFKGNVIIDVNAKKLYGRSTGGAVAQLIQMDGADRVALSQAGTEVISHGHITLADDIRVKWGNSTDMSMYYLGSSNLGILSIGPSTVNLAFQFWNGTSAENMCVMYPNAGINFFYNNNQKLGIISDGIYVTGHIKNNSGAWNAGHIILGGYHIWIDASGRLRIKSSAPTSDTDGTVVGSQS